MNDNQAVSIKDSANDDDIYRNKILSDPLFVLDCIGHPDRMASQLNCGVTYVRKLSRRMVAPNDHILNIQRINAKS